MKELNEEQMDRIIKEKFKQDTTISDKANSVFANFKPEATNKTSIKQETIQASKNAINMLFYKRLNRVLSVAAVSLTVVLVGGTAIYFNKDKIQNNPTSTNEVITYTRTYAIKNEPLQYSNEQVVKEIENHYVKAYLIGNTDVGVEFLYDYWDELNSESVKVSSATYKIDGIKGNIKDIFVGNAENSVIPYLFVLMEDGTAMYVDLHGYYNVVSDLYYYAVPLEGLTDIVGFEEKTRNFSYSNTEYTYVNAIRSDGKRKEVEIGKVNDWNDTSTATFDKYNEKYISTHNGTGIPDDNKGDFEVDGIHYWSADVDNRYVYYMKGESIYQDLYRVERSTGNETLIASGIGAMARNNQDGRISFYVNSNGNYIIYELDNNIVYRNYDESIINEVTKTEEPENKTENTTSNTTNTTTNTTQTEQTSKTKNNTTPQKNNEEGVNVLGEYVRENKNNPYDYSSIKITAQDDMTITFEINAIYGENNNLVYSGKLSGVADITTDSNRYYCEKQTEDGNEYVIFFTFDKNNNYKTITVKESYTKDTHPFAGKGVTFAGTYEYKGNVEDTSFDRKIDVVGEYTHKTENKDVYEEATIKITSQDDSSLTFEIDAVHGSDKDHVNIGKLSGVADKIEYNKYFCEKQTEDGNEYVIFFTFNSNSNFKTLTVKESYTKDVHPFAGAGVSFAGEYTKK
jgi:hypothetical protein